MGAHPRDYRANHLGSQCSVGDLKNGRTVHSLVRILCRFTGVTFRFVAPEALRMPDYLLDIVTKSGNEYHQTDTLDPDTLAASDVLYVTRIQKERFATPTKYEKYKGVFVVDAATMKSLKNTGVVMHPLPRIGKIKEEVDSNPRAAYFR